MRKEKVHITTLGCPKNQVDSEVLAAQLIANGYFLADSAEDADIAVINTCGFIEAAKRESIDTILKVAQQKESGRLKKLVVTGCMVERYKKELGKDMHEVDAFFGNLALRNGSVSDGSELIKVLREFHVEYKYEMLGDRVLSTPPHYAYLKISEGCDNPCSFCAIPLMRGKHASKPIEQIIHEAELLARKGVKEIIVVGQDTTYYGLDIYRKRELAKLLQRLNKVKGVEWIRLMYAYPAKFPEEVLDVIADSDKICKYIDIPIQHVSDNVLKSMRRGIARRKTEELLYKVRARIPDIAIRSTVIVGYPAEGENEFNELLQFVKDFRFDRLGAFTYSAEDGTAASILGDPVSQDEKERRHAAIMEAQRGIISELNEKEVGKRLTVLVDKKVDDDSSPMVNNYAGRTSHDAPEIDLEVQVTSENDLTLGSFVEVNVDDAYEYELYGTAN